MKVGLELGEVLDIALHDNDRIVAHLSLSLKPAAGGGLRVSATPGRKAASADTAETPGKKPRKGRKPMSPEARARMAAAQKLRWDTKRGTGNNNSGNENN